MDFSEARTSAERRRIIANNHPSSAAEIGFILSGKGRHFEPFRPALGALKSVGGFLGRQITAKLPDAVSHVMPNGRRALNLYNDLEKTDIEVLHIAYFTPAAIHQRLKERREELNKVMAAHPIKPGMV